MCWLEEEAAIDRFVRELHGRIGWELQLQPTGDLLRWSLFQRSQSSAFCCGVNQIRDTRAHLLISPD
jgi:hypothetical protein